MVSPIDLGVCRGYEYAGDHARTAVALPGAMLAGMPALWFAFEPLVEDGWRVVLVWDEFLDRSQEPTTWVRARAEAAAAHAGAVHLLLAKSLSTRAAGLAAERSWPAVWLTPPLDDAESAGAIRARTAPALLVGGTGDAMWDGPLARELADEVLELDGADHGLARTADAPRIGEAVRSFSARLRR